MSPSPDRLVPGTTSLRLMSGTMVRLMTFQSESREMGTTG